ncbi:UvrD-helicase domain-containing protein [Niveibacterium microcysteis]|uniref:ATP-dependent helicase n=1 Tax=Niveibacterium microcysteis TaxID=2811415 RepID=A0ABX7M085_9RHOO|nr:UvrD-helicase domain-containing protein [Niveibacterium microcysteis]QSI75170.1 ATP-dependent helicase [Niveibacterium microcysteis]
MTPSEPRFKPTNFPPTDEQLAIQTHRERKVVVVADAGAAKTTTLALRLAESLRRQVAPEHLLGLTFSDEAAAVLRGRLEEIGVAPTLARHVRIQTFRAFALQVLADQFNDRAPVRDRPEELAPMVREAVRHVRRRAEARCVAISSALPEYNAQIAEFLEISQFLKAQMYGLNDADEENAEPIEEHARERDIDPFLLRLHVEVERQRRLVDVIWRTSEDAVFDLVRLLDQSASSALPAFRVIVIDEMQDMNPITARLVEHMERAPRTFITAAGDFDQVIHSRRGATVDFVMSLVNAAGVERMRLSKTFRHGPAMTHATAYKKTTPTESGRVVRADIWVREYVASNPATAAPHVVKAIRAWRKSDEANRSEDQAVILRSPHLSIEIESALMTEGIAYRCEGFDSYLVRPETLVLRGIVAYALKAPNLLRIT